MTDARLELGADGADLVLEGDDLEREEGLQTAVLVSILSDARAEGRDAPTALQPETRGWWADSIRDRFGSRLWLLEREKRTTEVLERARELGQDALAWLIEDRIASRVNVAASYDVHGRLALDVEILRGDAPQHANLWSGTAAMRVKVHAVAQVPIPVALDQSVVVFEFDDGGAELFNWSGLEAPTEGYALTPRMDEMRARGVTFRRGYSGSICGPDRAMLHTGQHGFRTGLGGNLDGSGAYGYGLGDYDGVQTLTLLPRALRLGRDGTADQTLGQAAFTYVSAWFGKGHIFSDAGREDYAVSHGWGRYIGCPPNAASLENWPVGQEEPYGPGDPEYVTPHQNSGHFHFREIDSSFGGAITEETFGAPGLWPAGGPYEAWNPTTSPRAAWDAYKVTRDALLWINSRTKPFLAVVCLNPPHDPFEIPPYTFPDTVGVGATGLDRDLISQATQDAMSSLGGGTAGPGFRPIDPPRIRLVYRAQIEAVDTLVGLVWDRMDPAKRDRCVFIFKGDNGTVPNAVHAPYDSGHAKRTIFEMGARVPFFVWGSSTIVKSPNRFCDHLVHTTDVFSTILEITGCDATRWNPGGALKIDGRSFLGALQSPTAPPARSFIFNELFSPLGARRDASVSPTIPAISPTVWTRSYNDGTHKLIQTPQGATPPFRMFEITNAIQPGSGRPGYQERPEDDLYPLVVGGLRPDLEERFEALLEGLNAVLAS